MCTAISFKSPHGAFFGRNMDLDWNFGQSPILIPRGFEWLNRADGTRRPIERAILGMGTLIDGHPSMAEAMNEAGLACAGLNFPGYAYWEKAPRESLLNLCPYDFILWALSGFDSVEEVKAGISNIELVDVPINPRTPCPTLHWMLSDKRGASIVVEKTREGLRVFDNPVSVMTNDPPFDWHLTNLREYCSLSPAHPESRRWGGLELRPTAVGAGSRGIPGDMASVSRFVRAAFANGHLPAINSSEEAVSQCMHMLEYVSMVRGCVLTAAGREDLTLYSSCMDLERGIYYYKTVENSRLNAVSMAKELLDGKSIKRFPYADRQDINYLN